MSRPSPSQGGTVIEKKRNRRSKWRETTMRKWSLVGMSTLPRRVSLVEGFGRLGLGRWIV